MNLVRRLWWFLVTTKDQREADLVDLIGHMWTHSAYHRNGYDKMTTQQKRLYDLVVAEYCKDA